MKHLQLFEQFELNIENDKVLEAAYNAEIESILLEEEFTSLDEGLLKQVIGWVFLPGLSLMNVLRQLVLKKIKIKKMLANETNPKKKEKLKAQLKQMKFEEVKQKEKMEKLKQDNKPKVDAAKGKLSPEEKEAYAKSQKKFKKKMDKAKQGLKDAQGTYNGLV